MKTRHVIATAVLVWGAFIGLKPAQATPVHNSSDKLAASFARLGILFIPSKSAAF